MTVFNLFSIVGLSKRDPKLNGFQGIFLGMSKIVASSLAMYDLNLCRYSCVLKKISPFPLLLFPISSVQPPLKYPPKSSTTLIIIQNEYTVKPSQLDSQQDLVSTGKQWKIDGKLSLQKQPNVLFHSTNYLPMDWVLTVKT